MQCDLNGKEQGNVIISFFPYYNPM